MISIVEEDANLLLNTKNTIDKHREIPEESSGIGFENVKRRLNLLFPEKHQLKIATDNQLFTINLKLDLS